MQRYDKNAEEKNFSKIFSEIFAYVKNYPYLCTRKQETTTYLLLESAQDKGISLKPIASLAQLVEQRTENPCVPGSIPGGTTKKIANS